MAPLDETFDEFFANAGLTSIDQLLQAPELPDIVAYHILPGDYTSQYLYNNTGYFTSQGVDVVVFKDATMNGARALSCVVLVGHQQLRL